MFNKDTMKATGKVSVVLKDEQGNVKEEFTVPNLVVDTGLDFIASRMKDATATVMSHMEVGTDGTYNSGSTAGVDAADTALSAAVSGSRTALSSTTVTDNSVAYVCTFGAGTGTGALVEAGIFNAASGGTMLCRTVFSTINKGAADSMTITWTITIS